ncbi:MAG: hypothetical protein KatS3mg110_0700 [Pirellulaceae bacterium]|nr:MAG: hypothetical protein KatS3mg110_0700 [Pirellulaceae bacterium]
MVSRLSATLVLLWAVLAALALLPMCAIVYAELNCMERKCVEIPFDDNGEGKNVLCVRTTVQNGVHYGYAYGTESAHPNCYGKNSVGGEPSNDEIDRTNGHRWYVRCQPDCENIPDRSDCSGVVAMYIQSMEFTYSKRCKLGPDLEPDPEPDP